MSVDPDRTPAEYHLYSKYSDRQVGGISVDPDRTLAEYHLYSKYLDRQVGALSIDPDQIPTDHISLSIQPGRHKLAE